MLPQTGQVRDLSVAAAMSGDRGEGRGSWGPCKREYTYLKIATSVLIAMMSFLVTSAAVSMPTVVCSTIYLSTNSLTTSYAKEFQ